MNQSQPALPPERGGRKSVQKGEALWLMSFSDMSLVLLCFFVLMISTMKPHKEKFEQIKEGLITDETLKKSESLKGLASKIEQVIEQKELKHAASVHYDANGLQIEFKDGLIFSSGSASFDLEKSPILAQVLEVIASLGPRYRMIIEGHTDDTPLRGSRQFLSNWELSAARGFSLMRQFHKLGLAEDKISVAAFAHTKPKLAYQQLQGEALAKARAANRRVVIWIE